MSAFEIEPPTITIRGNRTKLRHFNRGTVAILSQLSNIEDENEKSGAFVVAFAAIYSLPPSEAFEVVSDEARFNREVGIANQELSIEDLQAVAEYIGGMNQRTNDATVTVDTSPGKQTTGETPPES